MELEVPSDWHENAILLHLLSVLQTSTDKRDGRFQIQNGSREPSQLFHGLFYNGSYYMTPEAMSLANNANNSTTISNANK
jgi:hypothetical protein